MAAHAIVGENDTEFTRSIQTLDMEGLLGVIQELQKEMVEEQTHFNTLKSDLAKCNDGPESSQGQALTEAMEESQERLQMLMTRTKQCFNQQSEVADNTANYYPPEDTNGLNSDSDTENSSQTYQIHQHSISLTESNNNSVPAKTNENIPKYETAVTTKKVTKLRFTPTGELNSAPQVDEEIKTIPVTSLSNTSNLIDDPNEEIPYTNYSSITLTSNNNSSNMIEPTASSSNSNVNSVTHSSFGESHVSNNSDNNLLVNPRAVEQYDVYKMERNNETAESANNSPPRWTNGGSSYTSERSNSERSSLEQPLSISSQSEIEDDEEKNGRRLSVAEARSLFEKNNQKAQNYKRSFTVSPKTTATVKKEHKVEYQSVQSQQNSNSSASGDDVKKQAPPRSISMPTSFDKSSVSKPFRSKDIGINMHCSKTTIDLSRPGTIKSSSGPVKPMSRAPVVRVAWSQKPSGGANSKANQPQQSQQQVKTTNASSPGTSNVKQPMKSNVTVHHQQQQEQVLYRPPTDKVKTIAQAQPQVKSNVKVVSYSPVSSAAVPSAGKTHPLRNEIPKHYPGGDNFGNSVAEKHDSDVKPSSVFQIPKLRPVQTRVADDNNLGTVIESKKPVTLQDRPIAESSQASTVIVNTKRQELPDDRVPPALSQPMTKDSEGFHAEDSVQQRITLKNWDPAPLLRDLYQLSILEEANRDDFSYKNIEGYLEKLPMNKRKATLLKTWKKRYFKAIDGSLFYYEQMKPRPGLEDLERATGCLPLGGGHVEDLGDNMIGIDDGRGRYLVVRSELDNEFIEWKAALETQVVGNKTSSWVKPVSTSSIHHDRQVIIIDLGSCSVRAGILGEKPTLPDLFFPTVVGIDNHTGQEYVGMECSPPKVRENAKFIFPVKPSVKVDKFSLNMEMMPAIFRHVFKQLKVDPKKYWIMFCAPANFSDKIKEDFMNIFIKSFGVKGVNIVNQTLLALYSYNSMSGIVVDIGERLEIVPVTDGYIVEQGVSRQPYGGQKIREALNTMFTEKRYRFFTDVEFQIVRLSLEKSCFVAQDYSKDLRACNQNPEKYRQSISLDKYDLPNGSWTAVSNDLGRFKSPEGLFNLAVWGMDNPPIQKLVQSAIQACPMDTRREMWRSVYLSGGVTLLPGFAERLQAELTNLAPHSITVEVHASPHRYHSAYLGACALATMPIFPQSCITAEEWKSTGAPILRKWHTY